MSHGRARRLAPAALMAAMLGCERPPKPEPVSAGDAPGPVPPTSTATTASTGAPTAPHASAVVAPSTAPPSPSASTAPSPLPSASNAARPDDGFGTGAAYFGCGATIPESRLWDETTEGEVARAIAAATDCAQRERRRVLLEFVAPWCHDCVEMTRVDQTPTVADVMRRDYERVRVNVGKWDRHEELRDRFHIKAIAAYVVLDPKSGKVVAQTTLEPVTGRVKGISPERWAAWLEHPR